MIGRSPQHRLTRWTCLLLVPLCVACAATTPHPTIATLRARAAGAPGDARTQRDLGVAELFAHDGDASLAAPSLARALALDANDFIAALASGIDCDVHGEPACALDSYLRALRTAAGSPHPSAPHVAELAAQALAGIRDGTPGFAERVWSEVKPLFETASLPMPARAEIGDLLIEIAYRRGDRTTADAIARRMGCAVDWRVAGPFGPHELLGFDAAHVDPGTTLAGSYDLGPGRGVRDTRPAGARGCTAQLGGGPLTLGGTSYAQADIAVTTGGRHSVRLDTPNSAELFVDGKPVVRLDRRTQLLPRATFLSIDLAAGTHQVTLKLASRHPSPVASLAVLPAHPRDEHAMRLPFSEDVANGFPRYLRSAVAMVRGDLLGGRATLHGITARAKASPLLMMQRANVLLADPTVPDQVREDEVRRLLVTVRARDARAWYPAAHLARMTAAHGRAKEAVAALRHARTTWPKVPAIALSLVDLLRERGWHAEADHVLADVRKLVPDACGPLAKEIEALRRRKRERLAAERVEALMGCEAESNARFGLALRHRDWDTAAKELSRLEALDARGHRYGWIAAAIDLAKNRQDDATVEAKLKELHALYPRAENGIRDEFDRLLAQDRRDAALAFAERALRAEPSSLSALRRLVPVAGGAHALAPWRRDGAAAIAAFEASGRSYDAPQVLVFDYMAGRLFEDGSSLELVHTIQKVQSSEAVNELAEVQLPPNALVLTLRTVKPDGRRLEPDAIAGKDTISLPSVAIGDYVELEYVQHKDAPDGLPGAYLGERFYFSSFEIPFDHSELVMILPEPMPYLVDPRGKAPPLDARVENGLRVLRWQVDESTPLKAEPDAVNPREYIPSVRVGVGVGGDWLAFVDGIRDALADRDIVDPEVQALAREIVGDAAPDAFALRAERLYTWVLANVEQTNDMFSQAAAMLRARSGNRVRILHYLFRLTGVPSQLALVRSMVTDRTPSPLADGETYDQLLVTFTVGGQTWWLHAADRWAPFGYLPPLVRGQPARLIAPGAPERTVPSGPDRADRRTLAIDLTLARNGSARFEVIEDVHGAGAVAWREQLESVPPAEFDRRFEEEYVARLVPGAALRSVRITGRAQADPTMRLTYAFDVKALGRAVGGGRALPPMLATYLAANYARAAVRTREQLVDNPLDVDVVLRIHLPRGARVGALPADVKLVAAVGKRPSFTLRYRREGDVLQLARSVRVPAMRVTPGEYGAFARFCQEVDAAEARELVWQMPAR